MSSYADATMDDIFGKEAVAKSPKLYCKQLSSIILENKGNFHFKIHELPEMAQLSRVSGIIPMDFDKDGKMDLVLAGNFSSLPCSAWAMRCISGNICSARMHLFNLKILNRAESGFWATGDIRNITLINKGQRIVVVRNNQGRLFFNLD